MPRAWTLVGGVRGEPADETHYSAHSESPGPPKWRVRGPEERVILHFDLKVLRTRPPPPDWTIGSHLSPPRHPASTTLQRVLAVLVPSFPSERGSLSYQDDSRPFPPPLSPPCGQVKFNPGRSDNMIIQSIALLDQLDKDLNTFAMRVREWYCWHFPELRDLVKDNYVFARCASYIQDRASLTEEKLEGLTEITFDEELSQSILAAAKTSMGMDTSAFDMGNIVAFTTRMVKLAEYRKQLHAYLLEKMAMVAPNLGGCRLVEEAGGLPGDLGPRSH